MYRRILVPIDGSPTSNAGLREAVRLARGRKTTLRLLHVIDEFRVITTPDGGFDYGVLLESLKRNGRKLLDAAVRRLEKRGVRCESVLMDDLSGPVADAIVQQAKRWRADLIVMGTHGRRGLGRALLGSDAERVLRTAPVPVLLVRSPGQHRARRR